MRKMYLSAPLPFVGQKRMFAREFIKVLDTAYNLGFANMPKVPVSNICGNIIIAIYGLCVGIFVGCIAVALAEILHTFPIIYKRMKLRAGLGIIVISMAIGKALGALYYFLTGFVATS